MTLSSSIRVASAALAVLAALAFVACGGKDASNAPAPASGAAAAPASDAAAGAPAPASEPSAAPATPAPAIAASATDHVVVEVNGQPIRAGKLLGAIEMNKERARSVGRPVAPGDEAALHQVAFDAFVADELLHQAAKAEGIGAAEAEIARELESIRSGFPSTEKYREFLRQQGLAEDEIRAEVARRIAVRTYVKKIAGNTAIPEAEARSFYEANKEQFGVPEQVHAAIIVVLTKQTDADGVKAEARKRIDEARKRAAAGEDFAALARQYSQIPNASSGGDLPAFARGDGLFPKIEDMAFSTPPGQLSPVFETPAGFVLLKTIGKTEPHVRSFDEIKTMLIADLGRQKEGMAVEAKVAELRKTAKIDLKDPSFLPQQPPPAPAN